MERPLRTSLRNKACVVEEGGVAQTITAAAPSEAGFRVRADPQECEVQDTGGAETRGKTGYREMNQGSDGPYLKQTT